MQPGIDLSFPCQVDGLKVGRGSRKLFSFLQTQRNQVQFCPHRTSSALSGVRGLVRPRCWARLRNLIRLNLVHKYMLHAAPTRSKRIANALAEGVACASHVAWPIDGCTVYFSSPESLRTCCKSMASARCLLISKLTGSLVTESMRVGLDRSEPGRLWKSKLLLRSACIDSHV